jgi:phosphopantothenoylcysteine synthetase/decarboxylase
MSTASAPRLTELYLRLADDPSLLEAYERDPRRALADAGFAAAEIEAVLESPERARAALDAEVASHPDLRRLVVSPRMKTMVTEDDDDEDDGDGGDDDEDEDDKKQ